MSDEDTAQCIDCGATINPADARCSACVAKKLAEIIKKAPKDNPNGN